MFQGEIGVTQPATLSPVTAMLYRLEQPNIYSKNWGSTMHFQNVFKLAADTPSGVLCDAWGVSPREASELIQNKRPMTIREAGALAEVHGLLLEDVLTF